jgi:hypothetical protein
MLFPTTRKASRRGRGGVLDLPIGVGRTNALPPTFGGGFCRYPVSASLAFSYSVPRTRTRTRRIIVYVYVYRFAVYGYVSGPS